MPFDEKEFKKRLKAENDDFIAKAKAFNVPLAPENLIAPETIVVQDEELQKKYDKLAEAFASCKENCDEITHKYADMCAEGEHLLDECDKLKDENESLRAENEKLKSEIPKLKKAIAAFAEGNTN